MGTDISYHIDGSTGGCIVVLQTLLFVLAMICSKTWFVG
ncbi:MULTISPECIES: metal ABC transporter permease [unclassified Microcoleus]|nr:MULTISPECIES: metal ABC transporter permease [unclassified Microcoleus]